MAKCDSNPLARTSYSRNAKELIDLVGQLRSLGAHIDVELPRIVVIGNQSAGKSSLVEAISGINVPRDAGTCTRCPMECRLSHAPNEWSCQIKIRWEYHEGFRIRGQVHEIDFGPRLFDKSQVELMLRRAQAAVLNPSLPLSTFFRMDEKALLRPTDPPSVDFSRNVVCIELSGPDLADLSFVDLPGVVQNAEDATVRLVEDLVNSYIRGANSLILVTLPMSDDIENQKAARLAKIADPSGSRTIGVLTKPDTLIAGATRTRDLWLEVLEGRRHPLLHGYYSTRQPDEDERARRLPNADARAAEADFFAKTEPWASSSHKGRLGVSNLVQNISSLLTRIIHSSLPKITMDVTTLLSSCSKELQALPPTITTDPSAFVLSLVTRFCNEVAAQIHGTPELVTLVQKNRDTYEQYKANIRRTAPWFLPYDFAKSAPDDISTYLREQHDSTTKGKRPETEHANEAMFLQDIRDYIRARRTRELPNNVPYAAKRSLIARFQRDWEEISLACFQDVQQTFKTILADTARNYFQRYDALNITIGPIMSEQLGECAADTMRILRALLKLESAPPFTQNTHYLAEKRSIYLAQYKDARANWKDSDTKPATGTSGGLVFPQTENPFARFVPPAAASPAFGNAISDPNFQPPRAQTTSSAPTTRRSAAFSDLTSPAYEFPSISQSSRGGKRNRKAGTHAQNRTEGTQTHEPSTPTPAVPPQAAVNSSSAASASTPGSSFGFWAQVQQSQASTPVLSQHPFASTPQSGLSSNAFAQPTNSTPSLWAPFSSQSVPATQPAVPSTPTPTRDSTAIGEALAALAKIGVHMSEQDLENLHPPDEYEDELELMAEVRAYFDVSYKRIIDYVPLSIDEHYLYAFSGKVQEALFEKLGLGSANAHTRCSAYIAEEPHVVATREELVAKKKRLEDVHQALLNFGL